jgi:hypothetical protein
VAKPDIWNNESDEFIEQMSWKYIIILKYATERILLLLK